MFKCAAVLLKILCNSSDALTPTIIRFIKGKGLYEIQSQIHRFALY